jgi:hypothetical protein
VGVGRLMVNHAVLGVLGPRRIPTLRPGGLLKLSRVGGDASPGLWLRIKVRKNNTRAQICAAAT